MNQDEVIKRVAGDEHCANTVALNIFGPQDGPGGSCQGEVSQAGFTTER